MILLQDVIGASPGPGGSPPAWDDETWRRSAGASCPGRPSAAGPAPSGGSYGRNGTISGTNERKHY